MAKRIKSGIKKHRRSIKKRDRNTIVKSDLKTQVKKISAVLERNDQKAAEEILKETESKLKKSASKGVITKKTASRRTGRLAKRIYKLTKAQEASA
ncbi:MAG: 30S ribosomal protein S20 [Thermodesulfobacteriota bacterium]